MPTPLPTWPRCATRKATRIGSVAPISSVGSTTSVKATIPVWAMLAAVKRRPTQSKICSDTKPNRPITNSMTP
jgi:hypothetical protein